MKVNSIVKCYKRLPDGTLVRTGEFTVKAEGSNLVKSERTVKDGRTTVVDTVLSRRAGRPKDIFKRMLKKYECEYSPNEIADIQYSGSLDPDIEEA